MPTSHKSDRSVHPRPQVMVKLAKGKRTCSCKIQAEGQGLGPDYTRERLYLLDAQERPVDTIAYIRGLENHPLRGEEPDIQHAINLIKRTNTRRPPDRLTSSDESEEADDEANEESDGSSSFHGFSTTSSEGPEEQPDEQEIRRPEIAEEDVPEYERILRIIQGTIPPEQPPRRQSSTRDDLLDQGGTAEGPSASNQTGARTDAGQRARTPPPRTSSGGDSPLRMQLRSRRTLMKAPRKKK